MSRELEELKARISKLKRSRRRGSGGGLYPIVGTEVLAIVEKLRAKKLGWPEIEEKVGLSKTTLLCWKRKAKQQGMAEGDEISRATAKRPRQRSKRLVPVTVKDERMESPSQLVSLTLTTPSGFKVEGLSEGQVRRLIGSLRCS